VLEIAALLVDFEITPRGEDLGERDSALEPGQFRTGAEVWAVTEPHVLAKIRPVDVDLIGVVEDFWVAPARGPDRDHHSSLPDRDSIDLGVFGGSTEGAMDRRIPPEHLLDGVGDQ
jgi:hypothetical protein